MRNVSAGVYASFAGHRLFCVFLFRSHRVYVAAKSTARFRLIE